MACAGGVLFALPEQGGERAKDHQRQGNGGNQTIQLATHGEQPRQHAEASTGFHIAVPDQSPAIPEHGADQGQENRAGELLPAPPDRDPCTGQLKGCFEEVHLPVCEEREDRIPQAVLDRGDKERCRMGRCEEEQNGCCQQGEADFELQKIASWAPPDAPGTEAEWRSGRGHGGNAQKPVLRTCRSNCTKKAPWKRSRASGEPVERSRGLQGGQWAHSGAEVHCRIAENPGLAQEMWPTLRARGIGMAHARA